MTRILGFGKNQLAWYEDGQVPSLSNGRLLSLIQNPKIMRKCVELAPLEEEEKKRILWKIKQASRMPSVDQDVPIVAEDAPAYGKSNTSKPV